MTLGSNHGMIKLAKNIIMATNIYPQAHRYTIVAFQPGVNQVIVTNFYPMGTLHKS
jgi:hypothetical protein